MTQEEYDATYGGTTEQQSHLRGQTEGLASRMPISRSWEEAVRNQEDESRQKLYGQIVGDQQAVANDLNGMMAAVRQKQARQTLKTQYANAALLNLVKNGGNAPEAIEWWNKTCRTSDNDATLVNAGIDDAGTFHMIFQGADGAQQDMKATPLMQYQMANNMPGIFSDADRSGMHDALLSSGHSEQELAKYSPSLNVVGGTTDGKATSRLFGRGGDRHSRISFFAADGRGGFSRREYDGHTGEDTGMVDEGNRARDRWVQTGVGPSDTFDGKTDKTQVRTYRNARTGETVRVKDGETPPWREKKDAAAQQGTNRSGGTGAGVEIAKINAASREKVAEMNNKAKREIAVIGADGRIRVAETQANALLEKTNMQMESYAKKNLTDERIATARNEAKKWIAELQAKTSLSKADVETKSKERIAAANNEARKAIAEGKSEDWLMGKQLDYDAKIEAIKASKMSQDAKNKLTERLEAERNAITLKVAEMRNETEQDKIDLGWAKEENAVEQKEADRQSREKIAGLRAAVSRAEKSKTVEPNRVKEINAELTALEKGLNSGEAKDRAAIQARISAMMKELTGQGGGDKTDVTQTHDHEGEIRTDKDGKKWRIIRNAAGKAIGKQPVQ